MTDAAQTNDVTPAPIQDAQSFIAAGFNRHGFDDRASEVEREQIASTEGQQAPAGAAVPNPQANVPAVPNGLAAPEGQGQAAPQADANAQAQTPRDVPASALVEERNRRRQAEQAARQFETRLAQLEGYLQAIQSQPQQQAQPQAAPADPHPLPPQFKTTTDFMLADPDAYTSWVENRAAAKAQAVAEKARQDIENQVRDVAWQSDDIRAKQIYGAEFVEQVKAYVKADQQLSRQFSQYKDPYTRAAQWAREEQVRRAIPNGDLNTAKANWLREALTNPELLKQVAPHLVAAQPPAAASPSSVPPSLGAISRSAGHTGAFQSPEDFIQSGFARRNSG